MAPDSPLAPFAVRALRRTRDWTVVDDVLIDHGGLDHVIVTPTTVLAVRRIERHSRRRDRLRARTASRALADFLDACKLHATVTPVLMRAGARAPHPVEGFRRVRGIYVVDGDHPHLWRHRFAAPVIAADVRLRIAAAIESADAIQPPGPRHVLRSVAAG